jgi:hypothetical protein
MSVIALISIVENESPDLLGLTRKVAYALAMQKPDTWYAYFHVRGSFAPEDVTRRVGVTPRRRRGNPKPSTTSQREVA